MRPYKYTYSLEQLQEAVAKSQSYAQAIKHLGLNASGAAYSMIQRNIRNHNLDTSHFTGQGHMKGKPGLCHRKIPLSEILEGKHPEYGSHKLRLRLLNSGVFERRCYKCDNVEWNGLPIPLEVEHIDGNPRNHMLSNLTILCPNCHAQTETHAGKNRKSGSDGGT